MKIKPLFKIPIKTDESIIIKEVLSNPENIITRKLIQEFEQINLKFEGNINPVEEKQNERWAIKGKSNKWYKIIKTDTDLEIYEEYSRHYTSTFIPTLISANVDNKQNLLLELYKEVCSSWKSLTDVRFKLLGFIPAVSIIAWGKLFSSDFCKSTPGALAGIIISLLGLMVTLALRIYDKRNDTLYNDLISRRRKIEEELGIDTGIFLGRRNPPNNWINHSLPINLIYYLSMAGWLFIDIWFLLITLNIISV